MSDACFVGHITGIKDIVGFHGESVAELRDAFEEAVDDPILKLATRATIAMITLKPSPFLQSMN